MDESPSAVTEKVQRTPANSGTASAGGVTQFLSGSDPAHSPRAKRGSRLPIYAWQVFDYLITEVGFELLFGY
jgi:hypothetical protein